MEVVAAAGPGGGGGHSMGTSIAIFKKPMAISPGGERPMKRAKVVLEEDAYLDTMSTIIERDFFPDLPKLRAQMEALEANGDIDKLREIELRYRRATSAARHGTTPTSRTPRTPRTTTVTPRVSRAQTPRMGVESESDGLSQGGVSVNVTVDGEGDGSHSQPVVIENEEEETPPETKPLSLDGFLATHTSEDNASFDVIIERTNERKRERYKWLHDKEKEARQPSDQLLALEAAVSGSSPQQPLLLLGDSSSADEKDQHKQQQQQLAIIQSAKTHAIQPPNYVARNALMYVPEGVPLSLQEEAEIAVRPPKVIHHTNTRFEGGAPPFAKKPSTSVVEGEPQQQTWGMLEGENELLAQRRALREMGLASRPHAAASPRVGGYGFVVTPSPMIRAGGGSEEEGVVGGAAAGGATPFMTWGTVDSTPLLISVLNDIGPVDTTPGPSFSLPDISRREAVAENLSNKASESLRKRTVTQGGTKRAFGGAMASPSRTPSSPSPSTPHRSAAGSASPAIARLLSKRSPHLHHHNNHHSQLRASYSQTPPSTTHHTRQQQHHHHHHPQQQQRKAPTTATTAQRTHTNTTTTTATTVTITPRSSAAGSTPRVTTTHTDTTTPTTTTHTATVSTASLTDDLLNL
eukprot:TRINITY_DN5413_c0_g1_i1.p1 TRINITY_DN5413_c0_g1~~TRINITY_DN5413_c0_g1_i1.p1  ORF type:complete len:643 (+),score=205.11 TRINITY_DN5413_c0_g1_i1:28-1929(+)